jgi:mycothiol synthase
MVAQLPDGFTMHHPTLDDVPAVTELMIAYDLAMYGAPNSSEESLRDFWQNPDINLQTDAWLVIAPGGQIVGEASLWDEGKVHLHTFFYIHPDYEGKGVREYLLQEVEARGRERITDAPPEARVSLFSTVSTKNEAPVQYFVRAGYTVVRHGWRMAIEMDSLPEAPTWPEGITVRTLILGQDEHRVFESIEEAFQDHWNYVPETFERWERFTVKAENFDPTLSYLAFDGDELAGALMSEYWLELGWVAPLAVRRPWRRKGLGIALLQHAFAEFYKRGRRNVALYVDAQNPTGATRLYERAGMRVVQDHTHFEKELRPGQELSKQFITA